MRLTGFQDRTAIVTGAAGGIGRSVVAALVEAGARVIATDTEAALQAAPVPGAENRALDVRDAKATEALVAGVEAAHGPLALGVHAAGVLGIAPILDMAPQEWDRVMGVNATGTFNVTRAYDEARGLDQRARGDISLQAVRGDLAAQQVSQVRGKHERRERIQPQRDKGIVGSDRCAHLLGEQVEYLIKQVAVVAAGRPRVLPNSWCHLEPAALAAQREHR